MFKAFFSYLRAPQEHLGIRTSFKGILQSAFLIITIDIALIILLLLVEYGLPAIFPGLAAPSSHPDVKGPWWIVALLGPIYEECTFRLWLKRYKFYIAIGLMLFTYMILSVFIMPTRPGTLYATHQLPLRIIISIVAGLLLYIPLNKPISNCRFSVIFYAPAIVFGLMHLINIHPTEMHLLDYVSVTLYAAHKVVSGLAYGYIRIKEGFGVNTGIHIANNLVPTLLGGIFF